MSKKAAASPKLDPKLEPPEGTKVQTGDEEAPESRPGKHDDDLKAIYKKTRKNRKNTTREEQDENIDAEMVAKMVAEAADEGEFEHTASEIDLDNRPDRFAEEQPAPDDPDYVPSAKPTEDDEEELLPEKPEGDPAPEPKDLDYEAVSGKVKVKVEGIEYLVPEADVIAAGGKSQYQRNRASNQRFEKAATYGKALQQERADFEQQQLDSTAKGELPDKDALSEEAELKNLREKILDAAIDGTEEDVDNVLTEIISKRKSKPESQDSPGDTDPKVSDQVVEDFETAYALDRAEANRLLLDAYPDIMGNEDLRKIAHSKYLELNSDPDSFGRTAVEMTREAGDFVRRIASSEPLKSDSQEKELAARREKKRVLPQPSEARSKTPPPETKKPRSNRQFIRDLLRQQGSQD